MKPIPNPRIEPPSAGRRRDRREWIRRAFPFVLLGLSPALAWAQQPPVDVTAVRVAPRDTPANFEFTGKTESSRQVEIRARVEGYVDKITYNEGDLVNEGQLLFKLDPQPFQAALDNAKGVLAQEQAKLSNARSTLARIRPLARENAVSKKDLDDAVAAELSAQAGVQSAKAKVREAELDLGYATIRSPLKGLSGRAQLREGSLVSPGPNSLLTTVVQLNPMWVNFSIGETAVLRYQADVAAGRIKTPGREGIEVELILADGSVYPEKGRLNFVDPTLGQGTGTLNLRAEVPNMEREPGQYKLVPGQFVRVVLKGQSRPNVILVPQRAVMQGPRGKFVYVVGADNKAELRNIEVGEWYGEDWIITSGLNGTEQVVVDGAIRLQPGASLKVSEAPASKP